MSKGYRTRINKYKRDPFRPQPDLRQRSKSRRQYPVAAGEFCVREGRCRNAGRCDECIRYSLWRER